MAKTSMAEAPMVIRTAREFLVLKKYTQEDSFLIFALIDKNREFFRQFSEETSKNYPDRQSVEESIVNPKNRLRLRYGIWDKGIFTGSVNLTPILSSIDVAEVGYWLGEEFTGKGYATVAVAALTDFAFEKEDYASVIARVAEGNLKSVRVLERSGYTNMGTDEGIIHFIRKSGHSGQT